MSRKIVLFERQDSVAVITLNNPSSGNAITSRLVSTLEDIRTALSDDSDIRVVVLTGRDTFCRGTDVKTLRTFNDKEALIGGLSASTLIAGIDRPTIAAIDGDALGQGLELALCCDLRICSDRARFAMDQICRGDIPWDGGTQRLARTLGRGKALEMIFTGAVLDAGEALQTGLVSRVVPPEELMPQALAMARDLAGKSPLAMRYAREAIYKGVELTLEQGLRLEADLYFLLHTTEDRTEGVTAFREKRSPRFTGR
ncbi:MAG: enoyl-CoA hydratase/isomerase family protein [Deltaproteobacteria bacterium]|nr:enoyl-CoA hydratase/isomerase family protein [Deltaproteobacteria bacterium]